MKEKLRSLCDGIVNICSPSKIILYGCKSAHGSDEIREVNLCIVVKKDPKETERKLYRCLECDFAFNLLVYNEEYFTALLSDPTSYASSIAKKGTVLHG